MRVILVLLKFVVLCGLPLLTVAQNVQVQFKNITFENGISDNRVDHVFQDDKGFLWLSTRLGIEKYNGKTTTTYKLLEESIEVNDFLQDKDGNIWVATTRGLYLLNRTKDRFELWQSESEDFNNHLDSNILCIVQLDNGSFLCGSATGDMLLFSSEEKSGKIVFHMSSLKGRSGQNRATYMFKSEDNTVWIGTFHGDLWEYRNGEFLHSSFKQAKNTTTINSLTMDKNENLWLGTNGNGLFRYHTTSMETRHFTARNEVDNTTVNNNIILSLHTCDKGYVWIGTDGGGLNLFNNQKKAFTYFLSDNSNIFSISDNAILDISPGKDGLIWTGTVHGGVSYFKNTLNIFNVPPSTLKVDARNKQGSRILQTKTGELWITAGRNGLRRYNPKTGETKIYKDDPNNSNDLSGNNVLSLFEDDFGRIWIGTFYGGLNIYDPKSNTFLNAEKQYSSRGIFDIVKDKNGNIWVGSNYGIRVYNADLKIVKTYDPSSNTGLSNNAVTALYKDIKGDMWVGTAKGLNVLKNGKFKSYLTIKDDSTSLSGNRILSLAENSDLSLLVGTYGNGLNRYDRSDDNFHKIDLGPELKSGFIYGIVADMEDNIWCSTNLGLSKIGPDFKIVSFGRNDGIPPFNNGKATLGTDGNMYFAGSFGLSYFKAEDLVKHESGNPILFFNRVTIINTDGQKEIDWGTKHVSELQDGHLTLPPDNVLFSIGFSTSNYWNPKHNVYSYKLDGLHTQFQNIGNQELLTFSNLKPGDYKLIIKVNDINGNQNVHTASMLISVTASFWEKPWVKALMFFALILAIFSIYAWRITTVKNQKRKLELLVDQKTTEIKLQNEKVLSKNMDLLNATKTNQLLKQKQLENELDFKTNELTNHTLREVHKNYLLNKIKHEITKEAKQVDNNKNLKSIISLIDDSLNFDKDWDDFYNLFNEVHPDFIAVLKTNYQDITDRETRLCALIRLNFSSQDIATLFGISVSSVKVARHRLRKKIGIKDQQGFHGFFDDLMKNRTS